MKKWFGRLVNGLLVLVFGFFVVRRIPEIAYHLRAESSVAPDFSVRLLSGNEFDSKALKRSLIVVFWATWCGPCQIELSRINSMILSNEISSDSVLAVSSFEDPELVKQTAEQRGYKFQIGLDTKGTLAKLFEISGTPTLILLNEKREIVWFTTGISPLLQLRLKSLFKNK